MCVCVVQTVAKAANDNAELGRLDLVVAVAVVERERLVDLGLLVARQVLHPCAR